MKLKDLCERCALREDEFLFYKERGVFNDMLCDGSDLTDDSIEILSAVSLFRKAGLKKAQNRRILHVR